jgi:hypothetical protein
MQTGFCVAGAAVAWAAAAGAYFYMRHSAVASEEAAAADDAERDDCAVPAPNALGAALRNADATAPKAAAPMLDALRPPNALAVEAAGAAPKAGAADAP